MIIGISGKAQAGKDTIGSMLAYFIKSDNNDYEEYLSKDPENWYSLYKHKYFALPLKEIIANNVLRCNLNYLNDQYFKKLKLPWLDGMTVRELLQKFGTGIRTFVHPNFWVNLLFLNYDINENWIITDVRFLSEVNKIKEYNNILIRVNRESAGAGSHISEVELDDYKFFDYVINNDDTLENLFNKVYQIYKQIYYGNQN